MDWQSISRSILDVLVLTLNGFLDGLYWLAEHWATVATWALALAVIVKLDVPIGRTVGARWGRYGRGTVQVERPAFLGTLAMAALYTAVGVLVPFPVPQWGVVLWGILLALPLKIQWERRVLRDRFKVFVALYGVIALGFLALLRVQLSTAALSAWSGALGQEGGGQALEAGLISSLAPWGAAILWFIYPVMVIIAAGQRFMVAGTRSQVERGTIAEQIAARTSRGED